MLQNNEKVAMPKNLNGFLREQVARHGYAPDPVVASKTLLAYYIDFAQPCILIFKQRARRHCSLAGSRFTRTKITRHAASAIKPDVSAFERVGAKFARIHNEVATVFMSIGERKLRVSLGGAGL